MDINIRKSIIENFKASSIEDLKQTINEATSTKEEKILPGLGVFFELLWNNASAEFKENTLSILDAAIKNRY